ncbi:MAG: ABC transporter permease [Candidatus Sumerlaeaceae bacterium]
MSATVSRSEIATLPPESGMPGHLSGGAILGIGLMVRRSLRQHLLSTIITVLSVALAAGLVMSVFVINAQTRAAFTGGPIGFDAVLGARGSQLQLVLNSVFHLETSPGNIPWSLYTAVKKDPRVALAVPYAVGDNYKGFRIVGTTEEMFTKFEYQKGRKFEMYPGGRPFDPNHREAVVGDFAARQSGLRVGSKLNPFHGISADSTDMHADEYVVTGILKPTNSPSDRVIWIPVEGIFRMEGHVLRGGGALTTQTATQPYVAKSGEEIPDQYKEISAVMLKFRSPQAGFAMEQTVNKQGTVATLAHPIARVMAELFDKLGWVNRILEMVSYLVVAVAAASILASIYNTISERRREFAILRALGARRTTVFSAIVAESASIAALGALFGFAVYAIILGATAAVVRARTGVVIDLMQFNQALWAAPLGIIIVGALAGILPAIKAYSTDVASNLVPGS